MPHGDNPTSATTVEYETLMALGTPTGAGIHTNQGGTDTAYSSGAVQPVEEGENIR